MTSKCYPALKSCFLPTPRKISINLADQQFLTSFGRYGWMLGFRPEPMLPSQVYRFDPSTGQVRVVADQLLHPNGIAFTPDGRTAFV